MGFAEFVKFTASLGFSKIEIRNDLSDKPEVPWYKLRQGSGFWDRL
jgi:hypothetical protein